MKYQAPVVTGRLIRRYKRFLADVRLHHEEITVHCPNTGSMAGLLKVDNPVRISGPHHSKRKYLYTLEQIEVIRPDGEHVWVGVNTHLTNGIVKEVIQANRVIDWGDISEVKQEVMIEPGSRIDLLCEMADDSRFWLEVKSVTLVTDKPERTDRLNHGRIAAFPDAVSSRGVKHLKSLVKKVEKGDHAGVVFLVQRQDAEYFSPADGFDPLFSDTLRFAAGKGVMVIALQTNVHSWGIEVNNSIEVQL